jgi:cytochrome c oxidase subunit 1
MQILRLGLVRGLAGQAIGSAAGMLLVYALMPLVSPGTDPWELGVAGGAIIGSFTFMLGVGAFSDWLKWSRGHETPMRHGPPEGRPVWTRYFGVDYNHKIIGVQYTVTSLVLMCIGGLVVLTMRTELARSGLQFLGTETFGTFIGMHGMVMIGAILVGVGGMANYLVPLMIGASDMAFPRLNAFAFWINVPGAVLLTLSMFLPRGWDTGWTGYPPLSLRSGTGVDLFMLGVYMIGLSSILGSLNLLVTTLRMRMPGMTLFRMPIFVWGMLATSIIGLTATQLIGLSFLMVVVERTLHLGFFDPALTAHAVEVGAPPGQPVLFQHLFWFYSHPAVYVFVLPGLGVISELLPVFARKPLFGYRWVAMSSMAIAVMGFLVWAHHMFTSGMPDALRVPFMFSTMLIAVPTGVKFFSWTATLWEGKLWFPTPMLFSLGAILVFLLGGLTGPPNGLVVTDLFLHDTYYVVGHFHATMFGGFTFAFFAALYYWFPKVSGRMYNERWGKVHFWLMFPAFMVMSLGQIYAGLHGMRRRIADYEPELGLDNVHLLITVAGFTIGISVLIMLINLYRSARHGATAPANPWGSRSPEWQIPSPPPEHSYEQPIRAVGEPYGYGRPGSTYVAIGGEPMGAAHAH